MVSSVLAKGTGESTSYAFPKHFAHGTAVSGVRHRPGVNILGVHIGHDSSASLLVDGHVVADVAEERFSRVKHFGGLPARSVEYCLEAGGLKSTDIDIVAVSSSYLFPELSNLFQISPGTLEISLDRYGQGSPCDRAAGTAGLSKPPLYITRQPLDPGRTKIVHVEHHLAHAASAYYTSGSAERQLVVTADGMGDMLPLAIWQGEHGRLTLLREFPPTASLGWFFSNVTEALGWWHGDGEGTTMGLAPYGDPTRAAGALAPFSPRFSGGELVEGHDFGKAHAWNETGAGHWHLEDAVRIRELTDRYSREDLAAGAQAILEQQMAEVILPWLDRTGTTHLSCAGGIFLNVKLNQRIWATGRLRGQHIYPNPGDSGLAMGAALYLHHRANPGAPIQQLRHLYWGPAYSDDQIAKVLAERKLEASFETDIAATVAGLLAEDKIVGWFQGRMEAGPRALGGRSILMSPMRAENKDIINARVKFREAFRPFCPSILAEDAPSYLERYRPEAFMITSFDVAADKKHQLPAVVHADGTLRPQCVEAAVNPLYWRLISEFKRLTGVPALLNTSLNIKGEPMICSPREAIRCFFDSGMDHLALGSYLLGKPGGS